MAFYSIEPWGPERGDLNAGIITSTLANIHRDPKRRSQPFTPGDFMPKWDRGPKPDGMDPELVKTKLLAVFGGEIPSKKERKKREE